MSDLTITLSYMTAAEVKRIGGSLRNDPNDVQPGFYLRVYKNEGYTDIVKYTRLSLREVDALSRSIDKVFWQREPIGGRVGGALRIAAAEHHAEAKRRREAAEAAIAEAQATLDAIDAEV